MSCHVLPTPFVFAIAERIDNYNKKHAPPYILTYIQCVKEKFGGLRVYISGLTGASPLQLDASDEIWKLIAFLEYASNYVCENCGMPGQNRDNGRGWLKTWCDDCRNADPQGN